MCFLLWQRRGKAGRRNLLLINFAVHSLKSSAILKLQAADFVHTIIVFALFTQIHGEEGSESKGSKVTVMALPPGTYFRLL